MNDKSFYMVLGAGEPTYKHATLQSARAEAERLARIHRGEKFYVLGAVGVAVVDDLKWQDLFDDGEEITNPPF